MAVHIEHTKTETYIYMNGKLLLKRWANNERSVHFDNNGWAYDSQTHRSIIKIGNLIIDKINY